MDTTNHAKYYLYENLHSPGNSIDVFNDIQREISKGKLHILYNEYQMKYGYNSNFIIPYYNNKNTSLIDFFIVIGNSEVSFLVRIQKRFAKAGRL